MYNSSIIHKEDYTFTSTKFVHVGVISICRYNVKKHCNAFENALDVKCNLIYLVPYWWNRGGGGL